MFVRKDCLVLLGTILSHTIGPTEVGCFPVWQTGQAGGVSQLCPSGAGQLGEGSSNTGMPREGCSGKFTVCAVPGMKERTSSRPKSMDCLVKTSCFIPGVLGETVGRLAILL